MRQGQLVIPAPMTPVTVEKRTLPPSLKQGMACDQAIIFEDPDLVRMAVDLHDTPAGCIRDRVVIAANTDHPFMADPALKLENRTERDQRQGLQCWHFLSKGFVHDPPRRCMQARIGDRAEPAIELGIQINQVAEHAAKEEVLPDVAERALNLALGLRPIGTAGLGQIAVMFRKFPERPIIDDAAILILADNCGFHAVVKDLARHAADRLERCPVASQYARHRLAQNEPTPDQPGEAQHHGEQPHHLHTIRRISKTHPELRKVDLSLLTRRSLEPHSIGLAAPGRTHRTHRVAHRAVAAGIAPLAKLPGQSLGAQPGIGLQSRAQVINMWVQQALARLPRAICRHLNPACNVFADRLAVDAHLPGYHGDLHALAMQIQDHHQFSKLLHRSIASQQEDYAGSFEFDPVRGAPRTGSNKRSGEFSNVTSGAFYSASDIRAGKIKIEREVIDIPAFIASITALHCDDEKKNGNDFSIHIEDDIGIMVGDRENIQQCIVNLLNNAFKFTENGQVSLSIERSEQKALPMVSFTVRDTGIGIDEQDIEALFIAFEQGDSGFTRKYGGTGLGLAITRNLARLMGGDCQVESVKGQGSTFRLILPAGSQAEVAGQSSSDEKVALAKLPHPGTSPYTPQHLHVLVIDDDKDALELIRRWLTQMGMTSMVTDSPDMGLALARQHKPDMILLDALLPNRSGYDLLTELRADEQIKDIPTVLITVDDDRRRAISVGASDYIRKPLSKDQLRSVVELYCGTVDGEILVIDDDDAAADLIKRSVEEAGFRTRRAANGQQGLAMADDQRPSAIVLDLAMPGLDGFGVLDQLKRHDTLHDVPLIVLSSKEITLDQHRQLAAAGQRFFTKAASTPRQIAQCLKEMVA